MKERIFLIALFIVFLISGFIFRFLWFYTVQKKIVEDKYFYKELKEDRGGAKTPQEAWNKYLDALEKGNIEEALLYVWPYERDNYKYLYKLKENNLLLEEAKNHGRNLRENKKAKVEKDELAFYFDYIRDKRIELLLASDNFKKIALDYWKKKGIDKEKVVFTATFKFNHYNKKWYIKD